MCFPLAAGRNSPLAAGRNSPLAAGSNRIGILIQIDIPDSVYFLLFLKGKIFAASRRFWAPPKKKSPLRGDFYPKKFNRFAAILTIKDVAVEL